ncbi:MAG TPA: sugar ABC transporter substrate-binding protein [Thermoanaerobaculia bacterium]|nr:sugar ABC transporter substrate-binding protein [Thermoanaerobaculia bacterium]
MKLAALAVVALSLGASGCRNGAESGRVTLEFWGLGREGEIVSQLLPEFHRRNPGIRVEVQQIPWTAAHEKLLTGVAGDATPDLSQLGNTWVPELVALDAIEPLDGRTVDAADYFPGIWATNVIDGRLYGVPWYVDTRVVFYRKDILARAGFTSFPQTWAEWEGALARVKQVAGEGNYSILLPTNEFEQLLIFGLQQDAPLLAENGTRGNFQSAEFRRALTFYVDMFRKGWAPVEADTQISNVWDEFAKGYFTFYVSGPWQIGEFKRRLPASAQDDWMTAPMPGPDGPGVSVAGGSSLVVFKRSPRQAEAWKLVEYLSEPAVQVRFYEMTGNLPPRKSPWQAPALADNAYAQAFRAQLERLEPSPQVPEWERIVQKMRLYSEEVVHGRRSIDDALASFNREVDKMLEKRRWLLARRATRG